MKSAEEERVLYFSKRKVKMTISLAVDCGTRVCTISVDIKLSHQVTLSNS